MDNLEILRAKHALKKAEGLKKESVNRLPGLIVSNGLLATLAFVCEEKPEREPLKIAMDAVAEYLSKRNILKDIKENNNAAKEMLHQLITKGSSLDLQQATYETLKYLAYLKRFSEKKSSSS
ncbi:type III-B CRISPR module-associated protein Cmr5 [Candidatus Methylacidiphilum fumarolicum]|uniref:CRISPR type III-B/RAMP module-associated protein Cmr5 n=2 Tax=Candidatus Methylacidiphilum fumarolicum TaxID=591154 RepID=I0JYZ9_METFB|nr:type III-B CRISPR module-associated protein Cmr5 [Candidatus Methylacidiphilum fumarolicum]MBW6414637.1 type III-B CRISPR module-associated protein Cmr5 [Candidatus Methylacidiphilum fumarolicum]TFE65657.1 type III-B CRISPR module-associated protein Cmr5 [Candidatus Methylacidiphilum fumarolicum]TFE74211.1 type III-B CRISPR module-associated protein Cmr5 [Candidatus Methylacidiphilum fumarolicum]TFE75710.1 type III-B CRISPR module-associated protein Cmr5 [Candidatus Methylacidiphilum fumarol